jgi:hypothetical protein
LQTGMTEQYVHWKADESTNTWFTLTMVIFPNANAYVARSESLTIKTTRFALPNSQLAYLRYRACDALSFIALQVNTNAQRDR